jgi:hypothetical protein
MKVKELIARLAVEDPEMRIVIDGYESGYDELDTTCFTKIKPNPNKNNKEWDGEFDEVVDLNDKEAEVVLYFPRKS